MLGHCAPYGAVITLAVMTAHHWRVVRLKLALAGITDPLKLPSMHMLLDVVEQMVLESMTSDKPENDKMQREEFTWSLYRPRIKPLAEVKDSGHRPPPAGFFEDDVEDAFDAFAAASSSAPR